MDTYTVSLILMLVGLILIALEPIVPGFFISVVGVFFAVMGLVGYIWPDYLYSPMAVAVSLLLTAVAGVTILYTYKTLGANQEPQVMVASSLVGKTGIVKKKIEPYSIDGKVEIGNTMWSAEADHEIPEGTLVKVIKSEGVHVVVKELKEK
jgi:membrane protein implicated in regulation of membrane protease activity